MKIRYTMQRRIHKEHDAASFTITIFLHHHHMHNKISAKNNSNAPESASSGNNNTNVSDSIAAPPHLALLIACAARWVQEPNAKKTSNVWAFFQLVDDDDARSMPSITVRCIPCVTLSVHTWKWSNGSNSMLTQLHRTHKAVLNSYESYLNKEEKRKRASRKETVTDIWNNCTSNW